MTNKNAKLCQSLLKELIHYDKTTGVFVHRQIRGGKAGRAAGVTHRLGYRVIGLKNSLYYAHRLAWLYEYGMWPDKELDHINGDKADNRIANLRLASRGENMTNETKARKGKKSCNLLGVTFDRRMKSRPWVAQIQVERKNKRLGYFETPELAHAAYVAFKRANQPFNTL